MKITNLSISGVGGIGEITIPFDPSMNILCGPNGIGKTTVLESIAHCFASGSTSVLKRNVRSRQSQILATFEHRGQTASAALEFDVFDPRIAAQINGRHDLSAFLLSLKTTRTFTYSPLNAVNRDTEKQLHILYQEAMGGVSLQDVKNWFVNRYLYSAHKDALSPSQMANFELAKKCFSALNPTFSFARVDASSNEILVSTPSGEIYYEYLSSGFRSCLSILFGIIKEVEFRFPVDRVTAGEFDGTVLIDEVELHLHPEWQYKITDVLTSIFPGVQFIVTTHSPHVIQSAEPRQIVALEFLEGEVRLRDLPVSGYGFKGWSVDEVLTDVMGMRDTRTETFRRLMADFSAALDREDIEAARETYKELDSSLHPASHVRKLLRLQMGTIYSISDD